ncbi:hypothetical protein B9Z55_023171 [Caenorhabditis nigoni]|uniref:Uncharacterized protein n=1 Tax=Caenorhabditis nigoni TaxID=1611254 RepID=A0A2G5SNM3_9PELO|nr:hypothetical protein B9Z55_023171 [Caenorhabditis nigoni]
MPYAYEHLTHQQKNSISQYRIWIHHDYIKLALNLNCPLGHIMHDVIYNKFGNVITTVKIGNEESPPIDLNFVDVFLEDWDMLLKHKKLVLQNFNFNCCGGNGEDCKKICEWLEMILKSRQLSAKFIELFGNTVDQSMSIVNNFDRNELLRVWLHKAVDPKNFKKYRKQLKDVVISHDDYISFKLPNQKHFFRNFFMKFRKGPTKGIHANSRSKEAVVRSVFETRLLMQLVLRHLQCFDM